MCHDLLSIDLAETHRIHHARSGLWARTRRPRSRWLSGCPPGGPRCPASMGSTFSNPVGLMINLRKTHEHLWKTHEKP